MLKSVSSRSGFSLVVVLAALVILTAIYAISSTRAVSSDLRLASRETLAARAHSNTRIVEFLAVYPNGVEEGLLVLNERSAGEDTSAVQPVVGLLDLNFIEDDAIVSAVNWFIPESVGAEVTLRLIAFRRSGRRYHSLDEARRVARIGAGLSLNLESFFTVHSGLVEPEVAHMPAELSEMFAALDLSLHYSVDLPAHGETSVPRSGTMNVTCNHAASCVRGTLYSSWGAQQDWVFAIVPY